MWFISYLSLITYVLATPHPGVDDRANFSTTPIETLHCTGLNTTKYNYVHESQLLKVIKEFCAMPPKPSHSPAPTYTGKGNFTHDFPVHFLSLEIKWQFSGTFTKAVSEYGCNKMFRMVLDECDVPEEGKKSSLYITKAGGWVEARIGGWGTVVWSVRFIDPWFKCPAPLTKVKENDAGKGCRNDAGVVFHEKIGVWKAPEGSGLVDVPSVEVV